MAHIDLAEAKKEVRLAAHAVGLDRRDPYERHGKLFYKPYRNYYAEHPLHSNCSVWDELVAAELATRETQEHYYCFHLTRRGLDWLGDQLGITIHDEED